nr:hypothetical protein [Tanacetum cinerariifolium]
MNISTNTPTARITNNTIDELLAKLLDILGFNNSSLTASNMSQPLTTPIALNTSGPVPYISGPVGYYPTQLAQPTYITQQVQSGSTGSTVSSGQATMMPYAFTTGTLHDMASDAWNFDTGASSHLNNSVNSLSENFNTCMYPSVSVGDGHSMPVTNTGHSILPTPTRSLHLNNVLITPHVVKNLIYVRQFVRDNNCTIEFYAFGGEVLRRLVSSNFISCNKEKPPILCHACQLRKHVRLPIVSSVSAAERLQLLQEFLQLNGYRHVKRSRYAGLYLARPELFRLEVINSSRSELVICPVRDCLDYVSFGSVNLSSSGGRGCSYGGIVSINFPDNSQDILWFHLTLLMAKKDMHTYVSRLKDTEHETLIATYDIPLDLRSRLPDPNFRMINHSVGDTNIGVLVRSGLSRVWCNPMYDPVLRRSDNTVMSIHDFLFMPSLDKATALRSLMLPQRRLPLPDLIIESKVSEGGSSGLSAEDGVEQTDDGTLGDDGQRDGLEFAMEDIRNLNDVSQDKEIKAHAKLCGGVKRTTRFSSHASHGVSEDASSPAQEAVPATDTQPLDTGVVADEVASDGNVDSYFDARGSGSESPPYTRHDWEEIHGVNLGLRQKELYKDHKADLGALKSECEATEYNLSSWDKKHKKYRNERDTLTKEKAKIEEELVGTKSQLEHRERQGEEIQGSIASAFTGVLHTTISVGVQRGLRMDRTDEELRELSQKVAGFISDAKEKFDGVIVAFPNTTFLFLDKESQHSQSSLQDIAQLEPGRVTPSSQSSSATASLRTNTHARHSTSSSRTFGHTSTPGHLKKKKKSIEKGGPSAV